jgi:hypothetical protein
MGYPTAQMLMKESATVRRNRPQAASPRRGHGAAAVIGSRAVGEVARLSLV